VHADGRLVLCAAAAMPGGGTGLFQQEQTTPGEWGAVWQQFATPSPPGAADFVHGSLVLVSGSDGRLNLVTQHGPVHPTTRLHIRRQENPNDSKWGEDFFVDLRPEPIVPQPP
jgi:hypothetical protein